MPGRTLAVEPHADVAQAKSVCGARKGRIRDARGQRYALQSAGSRRTRCRAKMYVFYGCMLEAALAMYYAYGIGTNVLDGGSCPCRAVGAEEASGIARFHFPAARLRWRGPRLAHPVGVAW
jgi:hypothetical protein